jgi:uncharacterized membrane protein
MENYILVAIISMVFFGVNAVIMKAAKGIDPLTLLLLSLTTATLLVCGYRFLSNTKTEISTQGIGFGLLSGVVYAIALVLFVIAIRQGKVSIVAAINALSAGVVLILAMVFLAEKLSPIKTSGIILAVIAAFMLSL